MKKDILKVVRIFFFKYVFFYFHVTTSTFVKTNLNDVPGLNLFSTSYFASHSSPKRIKTNFAATSSLSVDSKFDESTSRLQTKIV